MQISKDKQVVVTFLPQIYRVALSLAHLVEQMMVDTGQLPPERRRVLTRRDLRRNVCKGLQKDVDVVECEMPPDGGEVQVLTCLGKCLLEMPDGIAGWPTKAPPVPSP